MTGQPADPFLDAGYWLADQPEAAGLDAGRLTPVVTRLTAGQRRAKAAILAAYRSQVAALGLAHRDLVASPAKLDYELAWRTAV